MYGTTTLPNTGAAAVAGAGMAFDMLWLALLAVTVWALVMAGARLMPKAQV